MIPRIGAYDRRPRRPHHILNARGPLRRTIIAAPSPARIPPTCPAESVPDSGRKMAEYASYCIGISTARHGSARHCGTAQSRPGEGQKEDEVPPREGGASAQGWGR